MMLFQRELGVGEVFNESWDTFKANFGLVFLFSFIYYCFRLLNIGYEHLKGQRIVANLDPTSTEYLMAQAKQNLAFVGIDFTYFVVIMAVSIVVAAMLTLKFAQYYFDDKRSDTELMSYGIPRAFKAGITAFVMVGVCMVPVFILMVIVIFCPLI